MSTERDEAHDSARSTQAAAPQGTKTIDVSIEIDAPPEAVWQAISDADELQRWFPLSAEIDPGEGGSMTLAWGSEVSGTGTIEVWEEGRRLRSVEVPASEENPEPVAVDYLIEARGDKTVLRIVHAGFSADEDWAEYIDTIDSGWRYFLFNLKHYLERHRGTPRRMVWDRRKITTPKNDAWARLFGDDGLVATSDAAESGDAARLWTGDVAVLTQVNPPIHLACRCERLNDALLFVELEPGEGTYSLGVWLSLYGVPEERASSLDASLSEFLDRLF